MKLNLVIQSIRRKRIQFILIFNTTQCKKTYSIQPNIQYNKYLYKFKVIGEIRRNTSGTEIRSSKLKRWKHNHIIKFDRSLTGRRRKKRKITSHGIPGDLDYNNESKDYSKNCKDYINRVISWHA